MFRRKKDDDLKIPVAPSPIVSGVDVDDELAPPVKPHAGKRYPVLQPRAEISRRGMVDVPGATRRHDRMPDSHEGKKLIVGRDIELAGEITACDRLVVEGKVAADLTDAGAIEVAQTGVFRGSAEVDDADISGLFDGALTVRRKLIVRSSGQVRGTIRYARIIVELGGEIRGTIEVLTTDTTAEENRVPQLTLPHVTGAVVADPAS